MSPFGIALAILAAFFLPAFRVQAFVVLVVLTMVAASFEKPT